VPATAPPASRSTTSFPRWDGTRLFCGSDDGPEVNTVLVSLLASCGLHQIEPWEYLRDIFCLLPSRPRSRALELAPAYWKKALEDGDTQRTLAANPFRQATLDHPVHPDKE
jgi:hypothetical protein